MKDTISDFPEQLDTLIGERGVTLSGGQKQRATLARGLIRNAPILILDDCFSAVDTETEEHILGELKRLRQKQTTLLVSHRVSTARHADRIYVIDAGRIMESGRHEELLANRGYYAELERVQREGSEEDDLERLESHFMNTTAKKDQRDYAMFDADISGAVLNLQLLRRLLEMARPFGCRWRSVLSWCWSHRPYRSCCRSSFP